MTLFGGVMPRWLFGDGGDIMMSWQHVHDISTDFLKSNTHNVHDGSAPYEAHRSNRSWKYTSSVVVDRDRELNHARNILIAQ